MNKREQPQAVKERSESRSVGEVTARASIHPAPELPRFSHRSSNVLPHSVHLHIEELVLHGFNPINRYRIGEAVERELTRLYTKQAANDAIAQRTEIARLDGGVFNVQLGSSAEVIGTRLARAIYGGLIR